MRTRRPTAPFCARSLLALAVGLAALAGFAPRAHAQQGGTPLWTNRYNGPANGSDVGMGVATDANGNVFVTGSSPGTGTSNDFATVKPSPGGVPQWTNRYNGPVNGNDNAKVVRVDAAGNVIVTGSSPGSGTGSDWVTIKYSNAGAPQWTNRFNGPGNTNDTPSGLALDSSGNVFVTGSTGVGAVSGDYATVAYPSGG